MILPWMAHQPLDFPVYRQFSFLIKIMTNHVHVFSMYCCVSLLLFPKLILSPIRSVFLKVWAPHHYLEFVRNAKFLVPPRSTNLEILRVGPAICVLISPASDSNTWWSLRTTELDCMFLEVKSYLPFLCWDWALFKDHADVISFMCVSVKR